MLCKHLHPLEAEIMAAGHRETSRGAAWSDNCREWVYFDLVLDTAALQARFKFPACVKVHENLDQRSGTERGFYCTECKDGIMGLLDNGPVYR